MKRTLRTVSALVAALGVAAATAGCVESGRGDSGDQSGAAACPFTPDTGVTATARIAYQAIPNADLYVKDRGLLEACLPNATITWSQFSSGADVVQAFGAGSIDIGTLGSSPATKAVSAPLNLPVRVLWIHDVIGKSESLVVKDKSVTSIAGLRGKRIATPFGSTAHYSLLAALGKAGLADQVNLINLQPAAIPGAWTGGQIDAAWVWDPTLSELTGAGGTVITSSEETAAQGAPTFDVAAATTPFLNQNSAFAAVWAKVQSHAIGRLRDNPEEAAVSLGAQLGIAPEKVRPQLAGYTYPTAAEQAGPDYLGGDFAGALHNTAKFLLSQGGIEEVGGEQAYRAAIYPDAARAAAQ
ncbi:taurine ABC transporter substrate-binding protein [Nocardia jinanensis]|uniref:Glycine/betaine ABC transporter substrate-binding protein n=1 Tax=Nocardia jinanensis TaxID=382504 RepID=A0A917RHP9_9NOCA|nr:ABC transporter substrate-binding protein [Nocardia jinanensis]GGL06943.1 glycine/betaine ABC transporter substrate-binding protein [Nocardia jinanensis]